MTRKDFEAIARAINEAPLTLHMEADTVRLVIASAIAGELAGLCPNFQAGRFIRACTGGAE